METDFDLNGSDGSDFDSLIVAVLSDGASIEDVGVTPCDTRTAARINNDELVCEVFDEDLIPFSSRGEMEVGGCCCDDDTRGPCRCPSEHYVSYSVKLDRIVHDSGKNYAVYSVEN